MSGAAQEFRQLVEKRGELLRTLPYEDLLRVYEPTEDVIVQGRRGTISTIVEPEGDRVRIVVQGVLDGRLLRLVKSVALDGFYKDRSGNVSAMADEEFYGYD